MYAMVPKQGAMGYPQGYCGVTPASSSPVPLSWITQYFVVFAQDVMVSKMVDTWKKETME